MQRNPHKKTNQHHMLAALAFPRISPEIAAKIASREAEKRAEKAAIDAVAFDIKHTIPSSEPDAKVAPSECIASQSSSQEKQNVREQIPTIFPPPLIPQSDFFRDMWDFLAPTSDYLIAKSNKQEYAEIYKVNLKVNSLSLYSIYHKKNHYNIEKIWSTSSPIVYLQTDSQVKNMAYAHDAQILAVSGDKSSRDGRLHLLGSKGQFSPLFPAIFLGQLYKYMSFLRDGFLWSADEDTVRCHALQLNVDGRLKLVEELKLPDAGRVTSLEMSPKSKLVMVQRQKNKMFVWEKDAKNQFSPKCIPGNYQYAAILSKGKEEFIIASSRLENNDETYAFTLLDMKGDKKDERVLPPEFTPTDLRAIGGMNFLGCGGQFFLGKVQTHVGLYEVRSFQHKFTISLVANISYSNHPRSDAIGYAISPDHVLFIRDAEGLCRTTVMKDWYKNNRDCRNIVGFFKAKKYLPRDLVRIVNNYLCETTLEEFIRSHPDSRRRR